MAHVGFFFAVSRWRRGIARVHHRLSDGGKFPSVFLARQLASIF
jgi:hypothetical protein